MKHIFIFLGLLISAPIFSQIFPTLTGDDLKTAIVNAYKPASVLSYNNARDLLYTEIDIVNDTVYGIYSKHGIYMPPGTSSPRQWLYTEGGTTGGGGANAINAEHSYPKSKGASSGNGNSDLHHLFPSRLRVNGDRGSLPFAEIEDSQTQNWYLESTSQSGIPATNINAYSEGTNSAFEPRESVKGNIARAIMYFYTMYQSAADNADSNFFPQMQATLCDWHANDPIDSMEIVRSNKIAAVQSNKDNPFVLDCTMADRIYCPTLFDHCFSGTADAGIKELVEIKAYQQSASRLVIHISTYDEKKLSLKLINQMGQIVLTTQANVHSGENSLEMDIIDLYPGMYYLSVNSLDSKSLKPTVKKIALH